MSKTILRPLLCALAGVLTLSLHAGVEWSTRSCAPTSWQPLGDNVLLNVKGSSAAQGVSGYASLDLAVLTDGKVPTVAPDKDGIFGFRINESVAWTFDSPVNLDQIRISSCYLTSSSFDGVHVAKVEVQPFGESYWVQIAGECEYKGESVSGNVNSIVLSNGNEPVAQNVIGMKVTFGSCESGFANYYAEIEAVGSAAVTGPVLGAVDVTPAKTKASFAGSITDVGTDATACDVYLALNGAAAVKVAEGVTGSFECEISGLTAETTYAYELSVVNNAPTAKTTVKSGEFTTLAASESTAKWTQGACAPDEWTALKGNLLKGKVGVTTGTLSYLAKNVAKLTDGAVPDPAKDTELCGFCNPSTIAWTFDENKTLAKLRLSAQSAWGNTYHRIWVDAVSVKYSQDGEWKTLDVAPLQYRDDTIVGGAIPLAVLSDAETGVLAEDICGLKIDFSTDGTMAFYYAEIEAVGSGVATKPELGDVSVSPAKTTAKVAGEILSPGADATACDVYLSLDGAEAVKIAEGVTTAFEYDIEGLAQGTEYAWELSVSNNAPVVAGAAKSGTFTTFSDSVWTKTLYQPEAWQPLKNNVLANLKGEIVIWTPNSYGTSDLMVLSDGKVPSAAGKDWIVGISANNEIDWEFDEPRTIEQLRISSCYLADPSYSGVNIQSVKVKREGSDGWMEIAGSSSGKVAGDGAKNIVCATLTDTVRGFLADGVVALKVVFGPAVNINANYYAEVEAVDSSAALGPVLGDVTVEPEKTSAMIAGEILSTGTDATACDVYLSLNDENPIVIAEGVAGSFAYEIQDLTAETTYAYELTVVNNASTAKSTVKRGEFTTKPEKEITVKWETGDYAPADWTQAKGNLLAHLVPTESTGVSPYANKDVTKLTDGVVPTDAIASTVVGFCPNGTIAWAFDEPKTLLSLRISSLWQGRLYNGISIDSVQVRYSDAPETWVALKVPAIEWTGGSEDGQCAVLSDGETGCLADGVVGLKLTFGKQKSAVANYYAEIEAIGYTCADEATEPTFADPIVETPTATKAILSGSLASIGQKALYATLSVAWGADPKALGAPELLTDNAIPGTVYGMTLTDLTPETTYYYAFTARNDAKDVEVSRTGSFTMPGLTKVDCSLDIPAGTVSVVAGETTYTASGKITVVQGDEIALKAVPADGYVFERWSGDLVEPSQASANPLTIVMSRSCVVRPVVRPVGESVTVTWKGGEGAWENAALWDKGFVPTAAAAVVIPSGTCTAAETVSVKALSLSGSARLVVAEPNSGRYGTLSVAENLVLSDGAQLQVSAGPLAGDAYTFATGSGFVTVGGKFEIAGNAKFMPCCDQYTGGGVVTKASEFILANGASVEAVSLGYRRFPDREPASFALGAGTDYGHGASYGGYGDTWQARGAGVAPYGFANAPVHPGSHKYDSNHPDDLTAGGGNVRIHAGRVVLAGTVDVSARIPSSGGASAGGGIWITAANSLKVRPTAKLLAQGAMSANEGFGHGNGAGGRIALGLRLTDEEIAALAATGELPDGTEFTVDGLDQFRSSRPGVTVNLASGAPESVEDLPAIGNTYGSFRFLKCHAPGLLLQVR